MAEKYINKTFCRASKCGVRNILDTWNLDERSNQQIVERCKECLAYKFHNWLDENNYTIVKFDKPFIEE